MVQPVMMQPKTLKMLLVVKVKKSTEAFINKSENLTTIQQEI